MGILFCYGSVAGVAPDHGAATIPVTTPAGGDRTNATIDGQLAAAREGGSHGGHTGRDDNFCQTGAIIEHIATDGFEGAGKRYAGQAGTVVKHTEAQRCHTFGHTDRPQASAEGEGAVTQIAQGFWHLDTGQIGTPIKGFIPNIVYGIRKLNGGQ